MVVFFIPLVRLLPCIFITMLTRREILMQLKTAGVREWSLLKHHCRDFENYMALRYGLKIAGREEGARILPFKG